MYLDINTPDFSRCCALHDQKSFSSNRFECFPVRTGRFAVCVEEDEGWVLVS